VAANFTADRAVPEDAAVGTLVVTVETVDADLTLANRQSRYAIVADPTGGDYFAIDSYGRITVASQQMDYERFPGVIVLVVEARQAEAGFSATARVFVRLSDVNDHAPVMLQPLWNVWVDQATFAGGELLQVEATDADLSTTPQWCTVCWSTQRCLPLTPRKAW
jgi:hypothetical protein